MSDEKATDSPYSNVGIAGTGAIACGVATCATIAGPVTVLARSEESAERARAQTEKLAGRLEGADASRVTVTTDISALSGSDLVIESIVEDLDQKVEFLGRLAEAAPDADLASTTSSLSVAALAEGSTRPQRFYALHVFNPPTRMELVEVCFLDGLEPGVKDRGLAFCAAIDKRAVEVPDQPGFIVNRLLFPYLFDAARVAEETGMPAEDVDACMKLGAGHPMGPLALLDFIGLDVSKAIGESLHNHSGETYQAPPPVIDRLVGEGKLGRKSGAGFYDYS